MRTTKCSVLGKILNPETFENGALSCRQVENSLGDKFNTFEHAATLTGTLINITILAANNLANVNAFIASTSATTSNARNC